VRGRAAIAALLAAATAGLVATVLTRANDRAAAAASSLGGVVAQLRTSFGDDRIVRARVDGSTLHVVVSTRPRDGGRTKSAFEALVLAAAVADWMRAHGQEPISAVRYAGPRGVVLSTIESPLDGEPVPSTSAGSLRPRACRSVIAASVRGVWPPLELTAVEQLPYLHRTCVVRFRTLEEPIYAAHVVPEVFSRIARRLGDPHEQRRPLFFELDGPHGGPLVRMGRLPGLGYGLNWARPGLTDLFPHQ